MVKPAVKHELGNGGTGLAGPFLPSTLDGMDGQGFSLGLVSFGFSSNL